MAVLTDRQAAKKLVQQISSDHGYLSEEELRVFSPEQRRRVENALRKKDELIGFSIITQESLHKQGEKGIGFKSVFMVAWRAHIQSGMFSFTFTHRKDDPGMGMISPVWEDNHEELDHPLTRLTLHLHESGDDNVLARIRELIDEQFRELQETVLLFMKNLTEIHVTFYNDEGEPVSSTSYSIKQPRLNHATLKRTTTANNETQTDIKHFHVTTYEAINLSQNENRTYSETEESTRAYSKSQVVLTFTLSKKDVPIIKSQDIFVFLPVRAVGFKFLIQGDLVTDASRQDIVKDSLRNQGLLNGVADAFVKAIL
ncbi:hypothetical protein VP1G_03632 [Cytospora mali]|uniref:Uncharacterized protein n=1 Tax=Cytospora mali TaxID=578113 RepID=A0A194UX02_CYTMA|nr:hypothetical protein VP1G_03632 [Valsa mali var. pyri (nom. inval.)]